MLLAFEGTKVLLPEDERRWPAQLAMKWHREERFKGEWPKVELLKYVKELVYNYLAIYKYTPYTFHSLDTMPSPWSKFEPDELINGFRSHRYAFYLWPEAWGNFRQKGLRNWTSVTYEASSKAKIPKESGLYKFILPVTVGDLPVYHYLMYIGVSKNLRQRFQNYLTIENDQKRRPMHALMLRNYSSRLLFTYIRIEHRKAKQLEKELIMTYIPPLNVRLTGVLGTVVNALRSTGS